jgi:hypothetical protein
MTLTTSPEASQHLQPTNKDWSAILPSKKSGLQQGIVHDWNDFKNHFLGN